MKFFTWFVMMGLWAGIPTYSQSPALPVNIDITRGHLDPTPIAVPDFLTDDEVLGVQGAEIADVIRTDLQRSGLFRLLAIESFIDKQPKIQYRPNFANWRVILAEALIIGQVSDLNDGRISISFRLWDVFSEKQMIGMRFVIERAGWRRISHKIADAVYQKLTGESGYFDSRVVFVSESGAKTERLKRLAIMDQDGANIKYLNTETNLVLTPRFSPNRQKIAFLSYEQIVPQVYILDIETGQRELIGTFAGMTFAPYFSPKGGKMIMTYAREGNSDIYEFDLVTRKRKRLTSHPAIDVSANYSPDGQKLVFNSDRGGSPQLYVMDADGRNIKRISFGPGRYSAPVWSPRGDLIAFVKNLQDRFSIGVMKTDGSGERILTTSYLDEGPTWSPNGRVILFSRENRGQAAQSEIWSVDLTGRNLRKMNTSGAASDPAWSPLLP